LDDVSIKGRQQKLDAMAHELEGFRIGQQHEAERFESERVQDALRQGRQVLDQYGKRFEDTSEKEQKAK
jgi:hypothetical protein